MTCANFIKHDCAECNKNKKYSVKENKNEYRLINNNRKLVCKIRIDSCYINSGKRCDYLFLDCDSKIAFFIELKGIHIVIAFEQLIESINKIINKIHGFNINGRIAVSRVAVPNLLNNPKKLKLDKILKRYKGNLIIKVRIIEDII